MSERFERPGGEAVYRIVRVTKADSAFFYAVLEAQEGACAYSTLEHESGTLYRDIELLIPIANEQWISEVLAGLDFPIEILEKRPAEN